VNQIHSRKLKHGTWNPKKTKVWKILFLFKQLLFRFQPLVFPGGYIPISSAHAFMAAAGTAKPHSHHIEEIFSNAMPPYATKKTYMTQF